MNSRNIQESSSMRVVFLQILENGESYVCGQGDRGQLGTGSSNYVLSPIKLALPEVHHLCYSQSEMAFFIFLPHSIEF